MLTSWYLSPYLKSLMNSCGSGSELTHHKRRVVVLSCEDDSTEEFDEALFDEEDDDSKDYKDCVEGE